MRIDQSSVEARQSARTWLRETMPDQPWEQITDLARALHCELMYGPFGADYWAEADPICIPYPGWTEGLKQLRAMLDDLPTVYYAHEWGECATGVDEGDEWGEWEELTPVAIFAPSLATYL